MEEEFNWPWFINNIWQRENAAGLAKTEGKGGYYNGRYHPYKATNGIDVGPGFDLAHQSEAFKRKAYSTGLTTRRNTEREMFGGNYRTAFTGTGKLGVHINPSEYTAYEDLSPMIDNIQHHSVGITTTNRLEQCGK